MSSRIEKGGARFKPSIVPRRVKAGSQVVTAESTQTAEHKAAEASKRRIHAAARLQKRRLKRKELSTGKPKRPLSAYLLFVNSVRPARQAQNPDMPVTELTGEIAAEWRGLSQSQRTKWEAEASLLRQQYDSALESWKLAHPDGVTLNSDDESGMETTSEIGEDGEPIRRKKRRITASRKPHTVSDDEDEYRKQVYQEGESLDSSRLDPANVTMADLSTVEYKKGRAGPRTFEADRVYKRLVNDRRAAGKAALLGEHVLGEKVNNASPSPAPAANIIRTTNGVPVATGAEERLDGEEEIVGDQTGDETSGVEESAPETDADDVTDGEGASSSRRRRKNREASVAATDVSFRENRFAVQTRIVDGKIVLDETSLFANYGNGEEDRDNMEVVDEREGDRFVNASTYSRKLGRNRKWSLDETEKFYKSLQQWGTDFEMIARLFPGRDRVTIKKKFNVEERSNGKLVDAALKNSLPVNLEAYAEAIGVDLSGPPPEIKADIQDIEALAAASATSDAAIKKREATAPLSGRKGDRSDVEQDDGDDGYEYEEVVEIDDDGNEQVIRRRLGKKPGSKAGKRRRNSTRKASVSTPAPAAASAAASAAPSSSASTTIAGNSAAMDAAAPAEPSASADTGKAAKGKSSARSREPPSIGSRKSTRATRKRATSINSSKEAPGDGREVEEIVGEL
uniref:HMG box domain-containing protein n=1 Tax=Kalmanozyma brasiliensis (strain GHG001) TaxID=1365824 RepID=V5EUB7_KALBG